MFTGRTKESVIGGLIVAQVMLFCYLLALDTSATLFFALLGGLPVALFCNALLCRKPRRRYAEMSVVMFSAGGFGMLLGSVADLGQHGLLSWCQTMPSAQFASEFEKLWNKLQHTPWTYAGMFVGGNIGMFLFDKKQQDSSEPIGQLVRMYLVCNAGMLLGMLLGEKAAMSLVAILSPIWSAVAMVVFMLLGMMLGMIGLLNLSERLQGWGSLLPKRG